MLDLGSIFSSLFGGVDFTGVFEALADFIGLFIAAFLGAA